MKKTIFIIIAFLLTVDFSFSGINYNTLNQDSLKAIINDKSLADTTRLRNMGYLVQSFDYVMPDSMLYYARILKEESVKANYPEGIVHAMVSEGWSYQETGQNNEAMKYYLAAIKPAEESGQLKLLSFAYYAAGSGYGTIQMSDKALEYLLKAIKIDRELNDVDGEVSIMSGLTNVYINTGNDQKALEIELRMIRMVDSLKLSSNTKASALDGLGTIYKNLGRNADAIKSFDEALKLHQQNQNLFYYRITLFKMAGFFMEDKKSLYGKEIGDNRKSPDIAITYLEELESICRDIGDSSMLMQCYMMHAVSLFLKGEKNLALQKVKESEALKFSDVDLGSRFNYVSNLVRIFDMCGEYKEAAGYYSECLDLSDSLQRVQMAEKVRQLNESFQVAEVEGQLSHKEQQLAASREITYLFIALSALILIMALVVSYFLRQKQKAAKLLEQQNREIEKARSRAEQSEKFKERFLASMSHEIRTPLNAVIGMTGLLLDDPQPPKTENYLKNIRQAGEHLTGIINEILDLSRIDAGKLELHEAPFNLQKLLDEIGIMIGIRAKEKDLQLIISKQTGTPDWVNGDIGRIRQVLVNLAGNAVKFTEKGSVQVKMTGSEPIEGKTMVTFSVEDTGPGIPKELQAAIFDEFVQAGQEGEQKVAGTGLGLSISRKLVERMGGTLSLESEPGKGSVFSFSIPLVLSSEEAFNVIEKEKELAVSAMKGSFRILVVEDNPSNQIVTEGMLEKILPDSTAILAEDGFKALELLEQEKFDLVLMDIRMPGIDGYETTKRLRLLDNENAKIPIIALTASVIRADIQHCLEAGMNGYVPKPVSRAILTKAIRDQLKIPPDESFITEAAQTENFLTVLKNRPSWAERLFDLCNGKKDRFIRYLEIFQSQSVSETGSWQEMIDQQQHERLAFSIHKLLPHIRIFLEEKSITDAVLLDQELRKGWQDTYKEALPVLQQEIMKISDEAKEILVTLNMI